MSWKLSKKLKAGSNPNFGKPSTITSTSSSSEPRLLPCTSSPSGILTVTLHEGIGLSVPDQSQELPLSYEDEKDTLSYPADHRQHSLPYALLDYDKSQASISSTFGTTEDPQWAQHKAVCKLDVTRVANLTVHLYLRDPRVCKRNQRVLLGVATLGLFQGATLLGSQWLQVQHGTGRVRISLEYESVEERAFEMDDSDFGRLNDSRDIMQVKKKDTQRQYVRKSVRSAEIPHVSQAINHPFIVPLAFAIQAPSGVQFFTPFISGGHLFNHLQRLHRFDVDRSKLYAASVVCALEYLHETCDVISWLKPGNIFLDALGHIALCGFGLLTTPNKSKSHFDRKMPEYPAPELLIGDGVEPKTVNWWTLGILLYEMLIGIPPFYDDKTDLIRRNILEQPVRFPEFMEPSARDLLSKLLDRDPERRLGAGGAADIKAHAFFRGLDWQKLLLKKYEPVFKPDYVVDMFKNNGVGHSSEPRPTLQDLMFKFCGLSYNPPVPTGSESNSRTQDHQILESTQLTVEHDGEYELVWVEATREFYFHNPLTKTKRSVHVRAKDVDRSDEEEALSCPTMLNLPDPIQKQAALETALKHGYHHAVSQLLDYGIDLNIKINVTDRLTTPLQWAVEQGNADLVSMFLTKSTRKPERVAATRILGLAVDRQDAAVVRVLLANGVICDFEHSDRPPPRDPHAFGCEFYDVSDPEGFLPPLVRSVKHGNFELARLLLSNGANANVGYHDLQWQPDPICGLPVGFSCGRAVQLAMELDQSEIVQLLLETGADVDLEQPVWNVVGHTCDFVSRAVYQRVIHGLRRLSR